MDVHLCEEMLVDVHLCEQMLSCGRLVSEGEGRGTSGSYIIFRAIEHKDFFPVGIP